MWICPNIRWLVEHHKFFSPKKTTKAGKLQRLWKTDRKATWNRWLSGYQLWKGIPVLFLIDRRCLKMTSTSTCHSSPPQESAQNSVQHCVEAVRDFLKQARRHVTIWLTAAEHCPVDRCWSWLDPSIIVEYGNHYQQVKTSRFWALLSWDILIPHDVGDWWMAAKDLV